MRQTSPIFAAAARRSRAFTLVELMLGLLVTALVMGALAALLAAVAQGWQYSEESQHNSSLVAQAHMRLQRVLKSASLVGAVRTGALNNSAAKSAAMMIWKYDANNDWRIQYSELAVLAYHPPGAPENEECICYYELNSDATDTTLASNDEIYDDANIDLFMTSGDVSHIRLARNVAGCTFKKNDTYGRTRPTVEYLFTIRDGDTTQTEYGSAALRTPATMPVSQR